MLAKKTSRNKMWDLIGRHIFLVEWRIYLQRCQLLSIPATVVFSDLTTFLFFLTLLLSWERDRL